MSKFNGSPKRRIPSFIIYFSISALIICGCAARTSVEMDKPEEAQSAAQNVDSIQSSDIAAETETSAIDQKADAALSSQEIDEEKDYTESEPRIFIQPSGAKHNLILGIDFSMLPQGKSRLTVTTSKEVKYDLDRVDDNRLSLVMHDSKIGELLLKDIDTTEFQTAIEKIRPVYDKENRKVSLGIVMREIVPFHIKQTDKNITVDFGTIKTKISEKKIVPLNMAGAETKTLAAVSEPQLGSQSKPQTEIQAFSPSVNKKYKGKPLYLDFVNADVTHILRLINEVSEENIIWDPEIKGKKVSMILNNVPWDEALELILKNNELAKRYVGQNIVWITTKQKMAQILAEEEAETRKMEEKLENERQKLVEQAKREVEDAPLLTEYLPVDFAEADKVKEHIIVSKRGKITSDPRTNTIIIYDTASFIEEAKNIVKKFDTPVKQIFLEARIVEASQEFSRDLGIRWSNGGGWDDNDNTYDGTFSTNSPSGWLGNLGINFGRVTSSGSLSLNASIALAESEGVVKTLSAPKVLAQEGEESVIKSGKTIYTDPTENVAQESRDATLQLNVKPTTISYNNYITLNLNVTDNENVDANTDSVKEFQTVVTVKSGETIVLGGIIKESDSDRIGGVPVLKDIPGLGWIFKAKKRIKNKTEMLIFLTPTVMPVPVKEF
ncbi:MAG: hypothetical protein JW927_21805 [Deltaproteobacteria bacterium]|nr:hypothetical protein [Deltaproteobacteria bacterium]